MTVVGTLPIQGRISSHDKRSQTLKGPILLFIGGNEGVKDKKIKLRQKIAWNSFVWIRQYIVNWAVIGVDLNLAVVYIKGSFNNISSTVSLWKSLESVLRAVHHPEQLDLCFSYLVRGDLTKQFKNKPFENMPKICPSQLKIVWTLYVPY